MTEETHNAGAFQSHCVKIACNTNGSPAMSASIGIVVSIGVSAVLGFFLIVGLLFSIQDYNATVASVTGQPIAQILLDTVGEKGAIVLMVCTVTR